MSGLIPAWAGKTAPGLGVAGRSTAHPRVGGENRPGVNTPGRAVGSSPRGRGKPRSHLASHHGPRLIPAWAGKTPNASRPSAEAAAHPRVGGENMTAQSPPSWKPGSSPRGRGKRPRDQPDNRTGGLIPAWAGKTGLAETRAAIGGGSSPRGRGKPKPAERKIESGLAHPRVGGENRDRSDTTRPGPGSSPRGRGKLAPRASDRPPRRLIPAWAGKTQPESRPWP